jgi:5'-nucleotidase
MYTDSYERRVDPRDQVYFWLAGEIIESDGTPGTDITAIRDNAISITPITFDLTNETFTEDHQSELDDLYKSVCNPAG